jgi:hypothetical protein
VDLVWTSKSDTGKKRKPQEPITQKAKEEIKKKGNKKIV